MCQHSDVLEYGFNKVVVDAIRVQKGPAISRNKAKSFQNGHSLGFRKAVLTKVAYCWSSMPATTADSPAPAPATRAPPGRKPTGGKPGDGNIGYAFEPTRVRTN